IASCALAPCPAAAPAPGRRKDILYYNWSGTPTGDDDTCPAILGGSGHGTHTSGTIAGDTAGYADCAGFTTPGRNGGDGLAPGAKLMVQEMGDGFEYLNDRGGTLWNLADVAFRSGASIHSDSWGGGCYDIFGSCIPGCTIPYDSFARDADLAMWTYPDLLLVIAAGNAGQFCPTPIQVVTPANAKSPISVGSLGHGAAGTVSDFSSRGPVEDGRLKPTLAAQGESTVSAASDADASTNNCDTCSLDGTSMAAPTIAGLAALVREYYAAGFYAAGARAPSQGFQPSAALVKATLIDGAVPLGAASPSPDFDSGYGRVQLDRTLAFTGGPFTLRVDDHRQGITTGSAVAHAYDVAGGTPFRATLVWTDYPGALNAARARVNELKLEVIDPAGHVWFQTLDPATGAPVPTMNASDPHDGLNVEERLVFEAPTPGRWAVRVIGVDVPWGPQPFALVVRGALTDCPAPAAPGAPTLATPAEHQVSISWTAVPGAAAYNVYRSLGACPGSPWVPVASGVTGTSYLDSGMSGGTAWSYYVAAASDAAARCESAPSSCSSITPTGDCTIASRFSGIRGAASPGTSDCTVMLSWDPTTPFCGTDVRYNLYRSTNPAFAPGASSRIARCVVGTTYTDSADLASGATYYYLARAEDGTSGHGGPCRGGNEDGNTVRLSAA
ncbi:MAG TPA: S8 family serine peptidase, partial [Candidatus Polarisedimenticolia bacterium]|nr:S8 family serine peptidase [Candidatus Polarisedimenticolia bacterium]